MPTDAPPIAATDLRAWALDDPLLDWLALHGPAAGLAPDPAPDPRLDLGRFLREQGARFEEAIIGLLAARAALVRIDPAPADDPGRVADTLAALRSGAEMVAGGSLLDPLAGLVATPDLLVRADVLERLFPGSVAPADRDAGSRHGAWHHQALDIGFTTLSLLASGAPSLADHLPAAVAGEIGRRLLGSVQGHAPARSHLLGRGWRSGSGASVARGADALERLGRFEPGAPLRTGGAREPDRRGDDLGAVVERGLAWRRRLLRDGAGWRVLPVPSVAELWPNMKNAKDAPWHGARARIAAELADLTLLPGVGVASRARAHARGITRWDDRRLDAGALGLPAEMAARAAAVLAANRDDPPGTVRPARIDDALVDPAWRTPAAAECFVDFETVSDLGDDLSALPRRGGEPLIFQIGCGHLEDGAWRFEQWTAERLDAASERALVEAFVAHLRARSAGLPGGLAALRLLHWSAAETAVLETAWRSARARHGDAADWPELPWFDVLARVVRPARLTLPGAFGWGLKAITRAMHAAGLIGTTWAEGPADGLGAMVGAWWCEREAARRGAAEGRTVALGEIGLMREIGAYNGTDCRAMADIVGWLRARR